MALNLVEIERITFTVTTTGAGRPDYSPRVAASKLILDPLQYETASSQSETSINANSSHAYRVSFHFKNYTPTPLNTVPTGYKITLGRITVSCDESMLNRVTIYSRDSAGNNFYLVTTYKFDSFVEFTFGAQNAAEVLAGGSLHILIYNDDIETRKFSFNVNGFLERVS